MLWNTIQSYVLDILHLYYRGDSDIICDTELQSWAVDIHLAYGPEKGFASKFMSIDSVAEVLTTTIFTCSVQHAVLNFSQYETFAFVPFSPGTIFLPPPGQDGKPVKRGTLQMKDIFKALPTQGIAARQVAVLYLLAQYSSTDNRLGDYSEELFIEDEPKQAIKKFKERLTHVSDTIKKRGIWDNMLPEKIPNSTAI